MKLFADGAALDGIIEAAANPNIVGFTTNPTLMRQAGVKDYTEFAKAAIQYLAYKRPGTSLSLEVFADDHLDIIRQARVIDSWGDAAGYDVYVKVPVTNTRCEPTYELISRLAGEGIKLNVTAIFTTEQVEGVLDHLRPDVPSIVSIFAGRIADSGRSASAAVAEAAAIRDHVYPDLTKAEILWASTREAYNYVEAQSAGADIITMTPDLIKKMKIFGKDLNQFSLETVQMFFDDAVKSGFTI